MKKNERFFLLIFLIFIIGSSIVFSATLSGSIYDFDLNPAFDVRLTINSSPEQFFVSKNGSYSFSLLQGSYSLTAEQISFGSLIASAKEDIIISDDGMFILDILLFPFFEDEIGDDIELLDIESEGLIEEKNYAPLIIFFSFFIFVLLLVSFYFKFFSFSHLFNLPFSHNSKKLVNLPDDLVECYDFIKSNKRVTQKDLRHEFPLSEAKISLMVSDLESRGLIRKIKKGRGNIIILNK